MKGVKVIYFGDCMYSGDNNSLQEEYEQLILPELKRKGIEFENVKFFEYPPFKENYDILFFDWGGMSIGNSLINSFCRHIIREAKERPNTYYVMSSEFTKYAMEDAIEDLKGEIDLHNIFLNVSSFCEFYKKIELNENK